MPLPRETMADGRLNIQQYTKANMVSYIVTHDTLELSLLMNTTSSRPVMARRLLRYCMADAINIPSWYSTLSSRRRQVTTRLRQTLFINNITMSSGRHTTIRLIIIGTLHCYWYYYQATCFTRRPVGAPCRSVMLLSVSHLSNDDASQDNVRYRECNTFARQADIYH